VRGIEILGSSQTWSSEKFAERNAAREPYP
jgi:hypothetical protein